MYVFRLSVFHLSGAQCKLDKLMMNNIALCERVVIISLSYSRGEFLVILDRFVLFCYVAGDMFGFITHFVVSLTEIPSREKT